MAYSKKEYTGNVFPSQIPACVPSGTQSASFMLFPAISVLGNTEPQRFECLSDNYTEGAAEALF